VTSVIVISLLQFGQISIVGTSEHGSLVLMTYPFARRNVGASEKAHPGLGACQSEKQELRTGPVALRQRLDRHHCAPIIRKSRGRNRRPGLATTHGVRARHDQLTNAALAAWFGAFEEPPRMSSERDTCRRKADDAMQRAAQATEPSIKSAYEKVAEYRMLLARLESLLGG
jgi:hypothetical protein